MEIFYNIIRSIPLFRHCTREEITYLQQIGKSSKVSRGQHIDLKKNNSFNIIVTGMFEMEALGQNNIMYLAPGSFFGIIPFTNNLHRGKVKAITDSTILSFEKEQIFKFFLIFYKGLRGYLRTTKRMGFDISDVGRNYFGEQRRVISVYSDSRNSGKSLFASMLGVALQKNGKTIILDMSYSGNSLFNNFEKKVTSPLSHKLVNGPSADELINSRIENVDDNLDLINVSFGSKVRVEPDIISPLLFVLSREYKYIIIDISNADKDLRDRAFSLSDIIYAIIKTKKEATSLSGLFDVTLREAQRVYYVLNDFFAGKVSDFSGGYIFDSINFDSSFTLYPQLQKITDDKEGQFNRIVQRITGKSRALVLESLFFDSVFLSGFLSNLSKSGEFYDIIYSSSLSFVMMSLFLLSNDADGFKKNIRSLFSEEKMNRLLDITFPDEYVFQNSLIEKKAYELCGNARLEMFNTTPLALLENDKYERKEVFSTGPLNKVFASSLSVFPVFESVKIADMHYSSGFPNLRVCVEDLFRTDVEDITYVAVENRDVLSLKKGRILPFFKKYVNFLENNSNNIEKISMLADKSHVVSVTEKTLDINRIISNTEKSTEDFFNTK